MRRLAIVTVLVASPVNGLWFFCPPAEVSAPVEQSTPDRCQHVCPPHGERTCFASSESQMVAPVGVALGPICSAVAAAEPPTVSEPVADFSTPLRDLSRSPLSPPPKA